MKAKRLATTKQPEAAAAAQPMKWIKKGELEQQRQDAYLDEKRRADEARQLKEKEKIEKIRQIYHEEEVSSTFDRKDQTENKSTTSEKRKAEKNVEETKESASGKTLV